MKKKIVSLAVLVAMLMTCCMTLFSAATVSAAETDTAKYDPTGVLVSERSAAIHIGWKNPKAAISAVNLYEVTGATETELLPANNLNGTAAFSTASGASNLYAHSITGAVGDAHLYKLVFTFTDGHAAREYYIAGELRSGGNTPNGNGYSINDDTPTGGNTKIWTQYERDRDTNEAGLRRAAGQIYVDLTESYSGNASLKIITDHKDKGGNVLSELRLATNVATNAGTKYKLSAWVKKDNAQHVIIKYNDKTARLNLFNAATSQGTGDKSDWEYYEATFTPTTAISGILQIVCDDVVDALWVDDLKVIALDEEGTETGNNLVTYGGFEELAEALPAGTDITNATVKDNSDGSVLLSWINPDDSNYWGTRLYQKNADGTETLMGEFYTEGLENITIPILTGGIQYTYRIAAFDKNKKETAGQTVSVTPTVPDKIIGEITRAEDGSFSVTVKNNAYDDGVAAELILAFYEGTTMVDVISEPVTVQKGASHTYLLSPKASWNNGTLYVFLWDSIGGLEVLKPCQTYTVTAP